MRHAHRLIVSSSLLASFVLPARGGTPFEDETAAENLEALASAPDTGPARHQLIAWARSDRANYFSGAGAGAESGIPVDPTIREKRLLTGFDFDIGGPLSGLAANKFNMPFDSIECVLELTPNTLAVAIDSNFPGEDGRTPGTPDSSEFIQLRFERPVASYAPRRRR